MEKLSKLCRTLKPQGLVNAIEPRAGYTETFVYIRTEVSMALRPAELRVEPMGRWFMESTKAMLGLFSLL